MDEWIIKALVVGFVAWVVWSLARPRYAFEVRIADGRPAVHRGKVTMAFLGRVGVVCQESGVARGWIGGVAQGRQVGLRFSRHFPPGAQQRLRNEWILAG